MIDVEQDLYVLKVNDYAVVAGTYIRSLMRMPKRCCDS